METQGTGKNQAKDWRKKGLGWVPDYPDDRDYGLDSEEVPKSDNQRNIGNIRRNEVTKSIEDIADNLIQVIKTLEQVLPDKEKLKQLRTNLESLVFGEIMFLRVKVYGKTLKVGIQPMPQIRQLKYYLHLLGKHKKLAKVFQPIKILSYEEQRYLSWLNEPNYDDDTEKVVKAFQKIVKLREDGIVGIKTNTAIGHFLDDIECSIPEKNTPLVNFLPIPIWIQEDTFEIIFDSLQSWWGKFSYEAPRENAAILAASAELLELNDHKFPDKFFTMFKKEFYVVEPLVSAIGEMISPFAIQDDLNSALKIVLNKFISFDKDDKDDKELENSPIVGAILKVAERLKIELEEQGNLPENDTEKLRIKYYKFIQTIVEGYIKEYNLKETTELLDSFSALYLFEIIEDNNKPQQSSTEDTNIISVTSLNLLVNRKWYEQSREVTDIKSYAILPSLVDLTFWCSPIRDQGSINSCTAFAAVALLEYFARKAKDEYTSVSPLFLYKVGRNLMNSTGDVGASVRETMKAMVAFGVPPEKYWSYEVDKFDEDPSAFCYSYAQSYKTLKYFRLDRPDLTKEILLFQIQAVLAAGFPCIFGFTVYSSIYNEENVSSGCIPYPSQRDQVIGGHTVLAVGYDNYKEIKYSGKNKSRGALLIRNSWGTEWGQKGYGWLPYDYILKGLTADWWSLIKAEWFEGGNFGLGAYAPGEVGDPVPTPTPTPTPKS